MATIYVRADDVPFRQTGKAEKRMRIICEEIEMRNAR